MKPYKTLLILLVFMVLLYGPSFFQIESIHPGGDIYIDLPQPADLYDSFIPGKKAEPEKPDTVYAVLPDSIPLPGFNNFTGIEGPDSLAAYISLIDLIKGSDHQTRIMYYGDSQMEGDRITDMLRILLREEHGGSGPGLLSPTMLVPYTRTAYIRSSANWEAVNFKTTVSRDISHHDLGPLLAYSKFNSTGSDSASAWIRISPSGSADSLAGVYDVLRILYGRASDSVMIDISEDSKLVRRDWLSPTGSISEYSYDLDSPRDIEIRFTASASPDIYAISLESDSGIVVDNIALRASAGLEFTRAGRANLEAAYKLLDPELIILHFGLNIVLNIKTDYSYYEENIFRQIEHIKKICPGAEVLLVGVTDMARMDSSGVHSYPNIPLIVDAQRRAAKRSGVLFWDTWKAMGGEDAIVDWRKKDPPLASNDYTHLSYEGGHVLAELLYRAMVYSPVADSLIAPTDTIVVTDTTATVIPVAGPVTILTGYNSDKPLIFTTAAFWIFLLLLLLIYSVIFNKPLLRNAYLFIFSLFFYYKSGGVFFVLLLISTLTDYTAGWMIYLSRRKIARKTWLVLSLMVNLGMLAYFKYTGFITGFINDTFNLDIPQQDWLALISNNVFGSGFNVGSIILPVGISFFTFQTISYTIDVYRKKTKPVKNILDFGFYVSFFPQLVAGPIVRASEFIPQLYSKFSLSRREWSHALFLIVAGLIKKIIVSDYIALNFVDNIFASPGAYSGLENLLAIYGYGLQIYCDFSGYTDIAIGVALMLGFRLPVNFNSPYKAHNISDFWRRWHISLSRWLKDYLYIPLGGNRKGKIRTYINLFITMLLGGLWHGAAWRFIIWGGLHGAGLAVHKIWMQLWRGRSKSTKAGRIFSIFLTFNFVTFCWLFFRAEDMASAQLILNRIITAFDPGNIILMLKAYASVLTVIAAGYIIHFLPARVKEAYRGFFIRIPVLVQILIVYLIAIALYNVQNADIQAFIYFRF